MKAIEEIATKFAAAATDLIEGHAREIEKLRDQTRGKITLRFSCALDKGSIKTKLSFGVATKDEIAPWPMNFAKVPPPANNVVPHNFRPSAMTLTARLEKRVRAYLAAADPAVMGQRGHDAALKVATALVNGFGFEPEIAWPYLLVWNEKCVPPWDPWEFDDLKRKLYEALILAVRLPDCDSSSRRFLKCSNAAGQMRRPGEPSAVLDWIDSPEVVGHRLLYFLNAKIIANPLSFVP